MKKIEYIIFDLSEVLLTGIKDLGIALREKHDLASSLEHNVGWSTIKTPLLIPLVQEFFHGNVSEDEYIAGVLATYPQLGVAEDLKKLIRENFKEVEGTRDIIIQLKNQGYKLALLSVHAKEWIDYCEQVHDFHELFDVRAYSFEAKVSKPDPQSFHHVLAQLQAAPEQCLFIDDSEINIEAAEALGIASILFTDAPNLRTELACRGILIDSRQAVSLN